MNFRTPCIYLARFSSFSLSFPCIRRAIRTLPQKTGPLHTYRVSENLLKSRSVKVDWLKLRRKVLYCLAIFAIINEKLIKEDRPMCVAKSARRRRRSHCNIMTARGDCGGGGAFAARLHTHRSSSPQSPPIYIHTSGPRKVFRHSVYTKYT